AGDPAEVEAAAQADLAGEQGQVEESDQAEAQQRGPPDRVSARRQGEEEDDGDEHGQGGAALAGAVEGVEAVPAASALGRPFAQLRRGCGAAAVQAAAACR